MYPAVLLMYFISAAVILLASLALIVQVSLPFNNSGRTSVRTVIFPVVLYGCETWSPTLRGEHKLREFENRVPRRIFGPQRDDVIRECRRLFK